MARLSKIKINGVAYEFEDRQLAATVAGKADKSTTLSGYGITNAYTKSEIDNKGYLTSHQDISGKQDKLSEAQLANLNKDHSVYLTEHQDISGKVDSSVIGNLEDLQTTDKSNVVSAINEALGSSSGSQILSENVDSEGYLVIS